MLKLTALKGKKKIIMLTAYDFQTASILSACPVDLVLVGDSLGVVVQGKESTKEVTMEEMLYHTLAVVRGAGRKVVCDMPIHSYDDQAAALANARRFIEAGAAAVKLEGYKPGIVKALVKSKISVMGHLGVLPQTALEYKVVGKDKEQAKKIKADAIALCAEGVFAIVLECVPQDLAQEITATLTVPTIGIGAGIYCDGQVLVINDLLGLDDKKPAKFVKRYADLNATIDEAVRRFASDVHNGRYPDSQHTYH